MRQAGRKKVTTEPSPRGSQSLSHLHLVPNGHPPANISPQGEADVRSLEGYDFVGVGGGWHQCCGWYRVI
jgi:hypothetical protein